MDKGKAMVFTIIILALLTVGLTSLFFYRLVSPSPLGKRIKKCFVYPDGTPIGAGLEVTLHDEVGVLVGAGTTDIDGCVEFGSGITDGTYTIKWSWQGVPGEETVTITCEKIEWVFTNTVDCWTVIKYFKYDMLPAGPGPEDVPIEGLDVTFLRAGVPDPDPYTTDADGKVTITCLQKCVEYTLEWMWGEVKQTHIVHIDSFDTESPVVLENLLEPKSLVEA